MNILVTGGAGFIGSHLVDRLIREGNRVFVVDNLSSGKKEYIHAKAEFVRQDITDWKKISQTFKNIRPRFAFHLAAIPRVPISVKDPIATSKTNILGTVHVFKAAAEAGAERVIYASSSSVYGNQKTLPLTERMTPNPISPYALQKLAGEQFAKLFSGLYNIPVVSLRYFNVYGPRIDASSDYGLVIGKFLQQRTNQQPLTVYGSGKQTRAFCYVEDVVEANVRAMRSKKLRGGEVINIGSNTATSVLELAQLIGGEISHMPERAGDVMHTRADIRKAKRLLLWSPKTDMKKGLTQTMQWFQQASK